MDKHKVWLFLGISVAVVIIGFLLLNVGSGNFAGKAISGPDSGLVAYYPFSGNANDASGNSNNGEVKGATLTEDRFGNADSAYDFNGVDDAILVAHDSSIDMTQEFTITAWINPRTIPANQILRKINGYGLGTVNDGTLKLTLGSNAIGNVGLTGLENQWTFIASTWKPELGDGVTFYVNDEPHFIQMQPRLLESSTGRLQIGRGNTQATSFDGVIDEVRIYNRALPESEILEIYEFGETVFESENSNLIITQVDSGATLGIEGATLDTSDTDSSTLTSQKTGTFVQGAQLTLSCGNGVTDSSEQCDDGNTNAGDGCSSTCMIESGWSCGGEPSLCRKILDKSGIITSVDTSITLNKADALAQFDRDTLTEKVQNLAIQGDLDSNGCISPLEVDTIVANVIEQYQDVCVAGAEDTSLTIAFGDTDGDGCVSGKDVGLLTTQFEAFYNPECGLE